MSEIHGTFGGAHRDERLTRKQDETINYEGDVCFLTCWTLRFFHFPAIHPMLSSFAASGRNEDTFSPKLYAPCGPHRQRVACTAKLMRENQKHGDPEKVSRPQIFLGLKDESNERRVTLRYALRARVVFAWDDAGGTRHESRGHTRDVGQKGTFVLAEECPARGASVSLSIFLPVMGTESRVLRLEVAGHVLRSGKGAVQAQDEGSLNESVAAAGFAVSHQRVDLFSS